MVVVKIQGGLGNQLFQYASGRALSLYLNTELKLDLSFFDDAKFNKVYRLDKFNISVPRAQTWEYNPLKNSTEIPFIIKSLHRIGISLSPFYKRNHLIETDILKIFQKRKLIHRDYFFECWYNNLNYYKTYREIILNDLNADNLLNNKNLLLQNELKSSNSVAVHIRRGDFLTNGFFKELSKEYYVNAMKIISEKTNNPIFYFFSDDIDWAKKEYSYLPNVKFVEHNSILETQWNTYGDIEDLMLFRSCKHQIIANSTFSWWGAWLNERHDKTIISPKYWYNNKKAQKKIENDGILPKEWLCL
jgi:hypothetical protein